MAEGEEMVRQGATSSLWQSGQRQRLSLAGCLRRTESPKGGADACKLVQAGLARTITEVGMDPDRMPSLEGGSAKLVEPGDKICCCRIVSCNARCRVRDDDENTKVARCLHDEGVSIRDLRAPITASTGIFVHVFGGLRCDDT